MRNTSWLLIILVVVVGSAVGIVGGTLLATMQTLPGVPFMEIFQKPFGGQRYVRILMLGEDNTGQGRKEGHGLSDTLVVMAIDTQTKEVRAVSVPRDTMVEIPNHGTCKINAANVYGGPELARSTVQSILGLDGTDNRIDYHVATTTQGLRGMVDMLGGVYIAVDENMHYVDHRGHLNINLRASREKQLLNGDQAEQYVRFRHDTWGDSGFRIVDGVKVPAGRIVRQQKFMRALANRVLGMPNRDDRLNFLTKAQEKGYIVSDLKINDWKDLMKILSDFNPEKMNMAVLPGAPGNIHGGSYWIPDLAKIPEVVASNLLFQGAGTMGGDDQPDPKIEVLNGTSVKGVAAQVADKLRTAGMNVEHFANAPRTDYTDCCIITRRGRVAQVDRIAQMLRCSDIQEESATPGKPDITVIVGSSYRDQL